MQDYSDYFFQSPGQVFLEFGPFTLRYYGLCIALAFLTCLFVASKIAKKRYPEIDEDDLANFGIMAILGGLVGARTWFVLLNIDYFWQHPLESYQIWLGGQSIQGGILGAFVATLLFSFFTKKNSDWLDNHWQKLALIAMVTPIGQAIGRWGNFFNAEAFGSVTDLPWKLYIAETANFHHPTFLYESLGNLVIFLILYKLSSKLKTLDLLASYLFSYSALRLLIEPMRTDSLYIGSIKAATLISLLMLLLSIAVFVASRRLKA